ncbi:MAG: PQQ-binding-like beta-propeller repeat protein [Phycisphaerae bacterium]|nr:PQQ-binding-like beta-propeller repeat protein [Phycisphaerae bacterium]
MNPHSFFWNYRVFFILCIVLGDSAHGELAHASASDRNWTQDAGNAGHTRYVNMDVAPNSIKKLWDVPILYNHTTSHAWNEWDVAIDDSHVYRTALEGYPPGGDFHILALKLDSGVQQWEKTIRGRAHAGVRPPSVSDGIVYVNRAGHSGISGGSSSDYPKLYGLDARTGQEIFVTNYSDQWGSYDRPSVQADTVIMEGGYYGGIYAYEATSGDIRWFESNAAAYILAQDGFYSNDGLRDYADATKIRDIADPLLRTVTPVLASTEADLLLVTSGNSTDRKLSAFNESGDTWQWDHELDSDSSTFAATPDRVIVSGQSKLEILDRETGVLLIDWESSSPLVYSQLAVTNTHAILQDTRGLVSFVNLATGQTDWSQSAPVGTLAVGQGLLVLSSRYEVSAYTLVPEPSSFVLLGMGGLALIAWRRNKRGLA